MWKFLAIPTHDASLWQFQQKPGSSYDTNLDFTINALSPTNDPSKIGTHNIGHIILSLFHNGDPGSHHFPTSEISNFNIYTLCGVVVYCGGAADLSAFSNVVGAPAGRPTPSTPNSKDQLHQLQGIN